MNKKKVATVLGSVGLIAAIGIGGTFAYLTDTTEKVSNTFTVGDVGIDLKESTVSTSSTKEEDKVQGLDIPLGKYQYDTDGDEWTATENLYEGLCANEWVYKDPTIKIESGSQPAFLYAKIDNVNAKIDNVKVFKNINFTDKWVNITDQYKQAKGITDDITYEVYAYSDGAVSYDSTEGATNAYTIFNAVQMGENLSNRAPAGDTSAVEGKTKIPTLDITACAVQATGFSGYNDVNAIKEIKFDVSSTPEEQQVE
ncbi:SipW-cognate class signal peptide [Lachnospiraceae bacterium C7]|nr:SipW-cognate class signal peptide [Lachnospiraceae bacterium C7]